MLLRMGSLLLGLALAVPAPTAAEQPRFEALLINGGGQRSVNYQSHLLHLRQMHALLLASGVPARRIAVFSSDGADPAADLAVRDISAGDAWLLDGTHLAAQLDTRIRYTNSSVEGAAPRPATSEALTRWFTKASKRLRSGDTLLLYVTDHGTKNPEDSSNNRITLWGSGEHLSVAELGELLSKLKPGVRVVTLMSQCFSGSFANLMDRADTCGYFSTTEQRLAYGCYPENFDQENVGHSFRFIEALREDPSFPDAQQRVLVSDRTPDVPLRTSDVYLQRILRAAAEQRGLTFNQFVDRLLLEAWSDPAVWEPEIRLLDRIGRAFGFFSPRSLEEIAELADRLPEVSRELSRFGRAWESARGALNAEILEGLLQADDAWSGRLGVKKLERIDEAERQKLARELLAALAAHAAADQTTAERLELLNRKSESSRAAYYRMQVRLGAVLRMKSVLTDVAGRVYLDRHAPDQQLAQHAALLECEALVLPGPKIDPEPVPDAEPFPSYEDDLALAREVLPGWMGVRYRPAPADVREELGLREGAADISHVLPDSPAERAGIEAGDFVLGPPDDPFTTRHGLREWIMTAPIGKPRPLRIRRDDEEFVVDFAAGPYPIETPTFPGPPKEGTAAPQLSKLEAYRGTLDEALSSDNGYLLFFWATWCGPCKAAVPELLAFQSERDTPVIAITDESAGQLEPFLETRDAFLENVGIDRRRRTFAAYGVSGTPTFVLVDAEGNVQSTWFGYTVATGLHVPGWSWDRPEPGR